MAKTFQGYSSAQDSNTALTSDGGVTIPLGEGQMLPRHVNDAIRAVMADAATDMKFSGRPATQNPTYVVKKVDDNSAAGSMPAQANVKLEIDGALNPHLMLTGTTSAGHTYTFDTSDSSMTAPLRFYLDAAQSAEYSTGVTVTGTAGTAGAFTAIAVTESTPRILYYQLAGSAGVGGLAIGATSTQSLGDVTLAVTQAETARDAAITAKTGAETAKTNAETAEANAETAETNAAASAAAAATSAVTAATGASNSATAQAASEAARDTALTHRNDAQTAKADALAARDLILAGSEDNLWLGGFAAASLPTTDNNGDTLLTGAALYDTTNAQLKIYDGSAWVSLQNVYGDGSVDAHLNVSTAQSNEVLSWDGTDFAWAAAATGARVERQTKVLTSTFTAAADSLDWTHGQGAAPVLFWLELECVTAINGAAVGDIRQLWSGDSYAQDIVTIYSRGTTAIRAVWSDDHAIEAVAKHDTGGIQTSQGVNWKVGIAGLWL